MSKVAKIVGIIALAAIVIYAPQLAPLIGQWVGLTGFLATAVGSIVIAAGVAIGQGLLKRSSNGGSSSGASMEAGKVNVRLTEPPRWLNAGLARQGGGVLFADFDAAGNLWYLVVHSDSIIDLNTVQYYFDETLITIDGSTPYEGWCITDDFCLNENNEPYKGIGTRVPYFYVWTRTYQEFNPIPPIVQEMKAAFPGKWTDDHKLAGTTFSVIRGSPLKIEDRYKIYKWRGSIGLGEPAVSIVGMWSNVFDPRDSSQSNNNPSSHKPSRNAVLIWAWFRTHRYGRNKPRTSINWARVAEQASICDQVISALVGNRIRYQCGTAIADNKERVIAEQEILLTMDAQLVFDEDGKCWPRVGYYTSPTLFLNRNRDIVAMESVEAQNGESETQGVIVRYTDPAARYTVQPCAAWTNPLYYNEGEAANFLTVDILACQDHNQAMRLAKAIGMRSQPDHKILPTVGLRGLKARHERIINLNYDNTFAGDYEIVTPVEVDAVGIFCGFGLVPVDQNRWTLLAGEEKAKPVLDDINTIPDPEPPSNVTVYYANGRIEATFDNPTRLDIGFEFQYIPSSELPGGTWTNMNVQMNDRYAYSGSVQQGVEYQVRYRGVSAAGRVTDWSDPPSVITIGLTIDSATLLTVNGGTGNATVSWRNPNSSNFGFSDVYSGTTNVFNNATKIAGPIYGGLGQVQQITHNTTPGTKYYWVVARATDGSSAPRTGPVSGVVS